LTVAGKKKFDLYTFVASDALKQERPFALECNCSGIVTIMPPFEEEFVVCPNCESTIKILAIEGDPGFILGKNGEGEVILIPVQGSDKARNTPPEERARLLEQARESFRDK
jgi:hypothetical protein